MTEVTIYADFITLIIPQK